MAVVMFGAKSLPEALLTAVVLSSLSQLSVKVHSSTVHTHGKPCNPDYNNPL